MFSKFFFSFIVISLIKLLLLPSYKSTDFEVHRNWLAITSSLPISKWYEESTSIWTLDYPPFFAYFELFLSQFAHFFDPVMLKISSEAYSSSNTILFQRLTVILIDFIYFYACFCWYKHLKNDNRLKFYESDDPLYEFAFIFSVITLWLPSLMLVDHIHFQYNGFLNGILLLSILKLVENKIIESSVLFIILLNLKHIYLYVAPVYFVYILRTFCLTPNYGLNFKNCLKLATVIISIFSLSLGPFILNGKLKQMISRLFPVKRGLTHSYWAPNFWAFYNCLDRVIGFLSKNKISKVSMTGGLVQEFKHENLPIITLPICTILVVLTMMPALIVLWRRSLNNEKSDLIFMQSLILTAFSSFLFGWHVHEKAILMIIVPMIPLIFYSKRIAKEFFILNTVATFSIFPLLNQVAETPTKILLLLIYSFYTYGALSNYHSNLRKPFKLLNLIEIIYLIGFILIQLYTNFAPIFFSNLNHRLPFLPLLLTSIYCATGVLFIWLKFYYELLFNCY